jgi:hypothetical protein
MGTIRIESRPVVLGSGQKRQVLVVRPGVTINTGAPAGPTGAVVTNTFTQITPLAIWSVTHGLGRKPSVTLKTLGTTVIYGQIDHLSDDQFTVTFNIPQAGQALFI